MSRDRQHGFSLVEALVATALFGLVMVGVFTFYATNNTAFNRGQSRAEVHQNARVALDRMVREIRVAGYDLSGVLDALASPTPVQTATSDRLTFVAELTGDGVLDQVTYRRVGGRLVREIASWNGASFPSPASSELADGIGLLSFSYFDDDDPANNPIAAPVAAGDLDDIRRVTVAVVTTATTVNQPESFPLVEDVRLRN